MGPFEALVEAKFFSSQKDILSTLSVFRDQMRDDRLGIVGTVSAAKTTESVYATFFFAKGDEEKKEDLLGTPDFLLGGLKTVYVPDFEIRVSDHAEARGSRIRHTEYFDIMQPIGLPELRKILTSEAKPRILKLARQS